jgi:cytochrome c-type biogenesis protein CcmH
MGWLLLLLLVAFAVIALWTLNVRGALLQMCGAALLIGASGYALQGRPGLPGAQAQEVTGPSALPLGAARHAFFGEFTGSERWLIISESYARRGRPADAVGTLLTATRLYPRDPHLWVGLGNALVEQSRTLTPPAELAYAKATELAPGHPAAPFFRGLALVRSGNRDAGVLLWRKILADAPAEASWRPLVEDAVAAMSRAAPQSSP